MVNVHRNAFDKIKYHSTKTALNQIRLKFNQFGSEDKKSSFQSTETFLNVH